MDFVSYIGHIHYAYLIMTTYPSVPCQGFILVATFLSSCLQVHKQRTVLQAYQGIAP